jgi:hypothetical protein
MHNFKFTNKNKNAVFSLSLILLLATTLLMAFAQPSLAQVGVPQPVKSSGFISVAPKLVGVGQEATVNLWVFPLPFNYLYKTYYKGFVGITVTFEKPDGSKDIFMPVDGTGQYVAGQTQALGAIYFSYAPNMAGNWSVTFTMPEQNVTDKDGTVIYQACTSKPAYFTVQTEPVLAGLLNGYPWSQLPNSNAYWSYPISPNNREWSQISGDWLSTATTSISGTIHCATSRLWQPYGSGPNTGHIIWDLPLFAGGIMGGEYGSYSYAPSPTGVVVIAGEVFVNIPIATTGMGSTVNQFQCVDLATGKVLYTANGSITNGIHLPGNPYAQSSLDRSVVLESSFGSTYISYLFGVSGTTWNYYNFFNGGLARSISNVTAASYRLVDGTDLAYGTASGNQLYAWNISKVVNNNWPTGITWARPMPTPNSAFAPALFGISKDQSTIVITGRNQFWGYSTKDGTSLWNLTMTYPVISNEAFALYGVDNFVVFDGVEATFKCYSLLTGTLLWTSSSFADSPWSTTWTVYSAETNDYENLYLAFPDGTMTALDLKTGQQVWRSQAFHSTEYTNNAVPYVRGIVMVGGNIYGYAGYSTGYQINPIPRYAMMTCINATTGDISWTLNGGVWPSAAASGYVIGSGVYDGKLYGVGKGQTSTTVSAPQTAISAGSTVIVSGSVLDQSAAQPNTAAISDADMSVWMDYLHMQNATLLNNPPICTGVPVTLTAVDPNGNTITIGTTTSNNKGTYGFQWTPTNPGLYTIYANFAGTDSYYSSSAATYATVASSSMTSSSTPTANSQSLVSNSNLVTYIAIGVVAIIIAIAINIVITLRKKA